MMKPTCRPRAGLGHDGVGPDRELRRRRSRARSSSRVVTPLARAGAHSAQPDRSATCKRMPLLTPLFRIRGAQSVERNACGDEAAHHAHAPHRPLVKQPPTSGRTMPRSTSLPSSSGMLPDRWAASANSYPISGGRPGWQSAALSTKQEMERETGLEPATFCLGSVALGCVVARAWKGERKSRS